VVRVGRQGRVAATDQDDLLRAGFEGGAGGEAVVGAHRGERGDGGGDLRGGGGGQRGGGPRAGQGPAGAEGDDDGGVPAAERLIVQERVQDVGHGLRARLRLHGSHAGGEAGQHGRGAGRGPGPPGLDTGRIGLTTVICATRAVQGGCPVPLGRTLTG